MPLEGVYFESQRCFQVALHAVRLNADIQDASAEGSHPDGRSDVMVPFLEQKGAWQRIMQKLCRDVQVLLLAVQIYIGREPPSYDISSCAESLSTAFCASTMLRQVWMSSSIHCTAV